MNLPTSNRALGSLGAVVTGAVVVAIAIHTNLRGDPATEWIPVAAFGILFPTLYLVPASMNALRPNASVEVKRAVMGAMFALWIVAGGVSFFAGFRDFLASLFVAIGIVGGLAVAVRSPTKGATV